MSIEIRTMDALSILLARMKRAAPQTFGEFETEMNKLFGMRAGECIASPAERVKLAQGKAQQVQELCTLISECIEKADKLEAKLKNPRT